MGTRKIRITTNLQVYWDSILVDRTEQVAPPSGGIEKSAEPRADARDSGPFSLRVMPISSSTDIP